MGLAEKWFVFAMVWSVMAAVDEAGRIKLDAFLRDVEVSIMFHCMSERRIHSARWCKLFPSK